MSKKEVRICDSCGFHNDVTSLECVECGFDLSFSVPVFEEEAAPEPVDKKSAKIPKLTACDGSSVVITVKDKFLVGRDNPKMAEYFEKSRFISRKHCMLTYDGGKLYAVDVSTNGTFLNGKRIEKAEMVRLKKGDEITFADMKFRVE